MFSPSPSPPRLVLLFSLVLAAAPLAGADAVLRPAVTGSTPPVLGYNFAHYMRDSNARDYFRYSGIRHMRVFLPKNLAEPNDDMAPWGDGVTDLASFTARRNALRANPLSTEYINWPYLLNRYENQLASGNNRYRVNHAFGELRELGVDLLIQLTASLSGFPITSDNDWAGRWELWQHYYFQAFYMAREFDVRRWSMFNEPDHSAAGGITPEDWLERLHIASDAIQAAIADVNVMYGRQLEPLIYAPTTSGGGNLVKFQEWGVPALRSMHQRYDGSTDPLWRNFHIYAIQSYSSNPNSFVIATNNVRNAMGPELNGQPLPIAYTEWNVSTGAGFDMIPESMDSPWQFCRLGANAVALTQVRADHLYLFKFGMTVYGGMYPVQKNGMHHVDNTTGSSINRYGNATRGAEVWRHFVRAAGPAGPRPVLTLDLGPGAENITGQVTLDEERDRLYAFLANRGTSSVSLHFDVAQFGLTHDTRAIIEEVSERHSGILAHFTRVNQGKIGPFTMPAESTWLVTIPRAPQQTTSSGNPTLLIPASAAVTVRDGTQAATVQPPSPWLDVRHDPASADGRAATLVKVPLPLHHPDDIEFAVLTLNVATDGVAEPVHAHLFGLDDTSWGAATTAWSTVANLRQSASLGNRIRDSLIDGQGDSAHLLGQIVVNSAATAERHIDVTEFAKAHLGREVAFMVLQEPRWDVTLPGLEPGDTQPGGLRIVSTTNPDAGSLSPRIRFVRRLDSNNDGLGDRLKLALGLDPNSTDSDGNGVPDAVEVLVLGTDPLNPDAGPREHWAMTLAGGDSALEAMLLDPLADPDGDGRPNLMEFALGLDPFDPADAPLIEAGLDGEHLVFTYARRAPAAGAAFTVEFSADLATWTAGGTVIAVVPEGGRDVVSVRAPSQAHRFARLRVSLPGM